MNDDVKETLLVLALALVRTGKEFDHCAPEVEYWMPALARNIQQIIKGRS